MTLLPNAQISVSGNNIFAVYNNNFYMMDAPFGLVGSSPNQIPSLPVDANWIQLMSNESAPQVQSVIFDDFLPNTGYALVSGSNNIFKFVINTSNQTVSYLEWYISATTFSLYLSKAINFTYTTTASLTQYNIESLQLINTVNFNNTFINGMALSRAEDYLYVSTATNSSVQIYNYKFLTLLYTLSNLNPAGVFGVFTSTETTPTAIRPFYNISDVIDAVNLAFLSAYNQLKAEIVGIFPVDECPFFTLDYATKCLTLNYDSKFQSVSGNGIFVNTELYQFFKLPQQTSNQSGFIQYLLSPMGLTVQTKQSVFSLMQVDKIVVKTNLNIFSDFEDSSNVKSNLVFTDLDLDTSADFFNLGGSFLYSAVLLRNYCLVSNAQLRNISYQIFIQYLDGSQVEYKIPTGQNVSIKLQFSRLY